MNPKALLSKKDVADLKVLLVRFNRTILHCADLRIEDYTPDQVKNLFNLLELTQQTLINISEFMSQYDFLTKPPKMKKG